MADIKEKVENELKTVKSLCETMEHAIKTQIDKGLDNVNTHELYEAVDIYKDLSEVKKNIIEGCYKMQIMEAMEEYGEESEDEEGEEVRFYRGQPRSSRTGRYMRRRSGNRRNFESPIMYHDYDMYPMELYRDMDRWDGKMYYNGGGSGSSGGSGGSGSSGGNRGGSGSGSSSGGQSGGSSRSYSEGYSDGQNRGYEDGNRRGYEDGEREGYERGYSEGERRGRSEGQRSNQRDSREGRSGQSRRSYMDSKEIHADNSPESKQAKMKELEKYMNELAGDMTEMISGASNEEKTMLKAKLQNLQQKIQ